MEPETETSSPASASDLYQPSRPAARHLVRGPGGPVGGLATGIARYLGVDPLAVQIGFVVGAFIGGVGVLLYIAGWLLVPAFDKNPAERQGATRIILGSLGLGAAVLAVLSMSNDSLTIAFVLIGAGCYLLTQRPDDAAVRSEDVRDLLRSRGQDESGRSWGTVQTDGADLGRMGYASPGYQPPPPQADGASRSSFDDGTPGPPITSVTLAICALAVGFCMRLDVSASMRAVAACSATLALCGFGLVVSSFVGRARGLFLVGLLAALGIVIAVVLFGQDGDFRFGEARYEVSDEASLADRYNLGAGELVVDLTAVHLSADRPLVVSGGAVTVTIVLPESMAVDVGASAGVGDITIFGVNRESARAEVERRYRPTDYVQGDPTLTLDVSVGVGDIEVRHGD